MTESLEELEEAGDDWKALEMPAENLGVLKKPDTNWKTLEMSGSLEELEKPMMLFLPSLVQLLPKSLRLMRNCQLQEMLNLANR